MFLLSFADASFGVPKPFWYIARAVSSVVLEKRPGKRINSSHFSVASTGSQGPDVSAVGTVLSAKTPRQPSAKGPVSFLGKICSVWIRCVILAFHMIHS